jgi:hypothetical protein
MTQEIQTRIRTKFKTLAATGGKGSCLSLSLLRWQDGSPKLLLDVFITTWGKRDKENRAKGIKAEN